MQKNRLFTPLVLITFVDMCLLGFLNSMRGVSFPLLRNGFNVSYSDMGLLSALASFTMVCFCIISGNIMQRFGLKKNIISGFFIIMLAAASFYVASGFWIAVGIYLILQSGIGFFEIGLNGIGARIFTVKSGLMMNLLHFCYGFGAIIGPRFMGVLSNRGMGWQQVYSLALIPVFILLVLTLAVRFPAKTETAAVKEGPSFWTVLKNPLVWLFGCILGVTGSIDGGFVTWIGLYLYDVYGLDPSTVGAALISAFFVLFTISRLLSGFIVEKAGYMKSVLLSSFVIAVLFAAAFILGIRGIYLFPVIGFFVAIMFPTVLAISVVVFKEQAQTVSSAILCISFTLGGIIHYIIGLSNRFFGAAWGYRTCLIYSIILIILLFQLKRRTKA